MENSNKAKYSNYDPENKAKGDEFERKVAEYYSKEGYNVWNRSASMGNQDKGIDLIAFKDEEILLIQCKWGQRTDTLGVEVYNKMINGYKKIKDTIIKKSDNAKYKLVLACRDLSKEGKKSMVNNMLFECFIRYADDIKYKYPDIIEKQIIFFDDANEQLKLVREENSKCEKEQNNAKEKADAMAIVVFIYKCLEVYEEILKSLEKNKSNEAKEQRNFILASIENLEIYYNTRKEKITKILQEDIIEEIEQKLRVFNAYA